MVMPRRQFFGQLAVLFEYREERDVAGRDGGENLVLFYPVRI